VQINFTKLIDDVQCYQTVRELRWPDGVACPSCESQEVSPGTHASGLIADPQSDTGILNYHTKPLTAPLSACVGRRL
jgi:hypothetical protein